MPQYPQQMQQSQGYPSRKFQQAPPKLKCYRCGGNHLVKDCPEPPPPRRLPPIDRFCDGCAVDHLPKDCPVRAFISQTPGPKTVLNYIGVIPSPHREEAEADNRSLKVVTRAQSRALQAELEHKQVQTEPVAKKKRSRKARSR